MKSITLLCFMLTAACASAQVSIIAHRGASFYAPENTLAAVNLAWEQQADAVEIDVYLTTDNRVVAFHDKTTKRVSRPVAELDIAQSSSDALRQLDVGSWKSDKYANERIPFIEEVLATIPEGKRLVIEIKSDRAIIPALQEAMQKSGKKDQIDFIAFDLPTITALKKVFPGNRCFWICGKPKHLLAGMAQSSAAGLDGVDLKFDLIDAAVMAKAKELNLDMWTWTVDDLAEARRLATLGVTGITTNRPEWLRKGLENTSQ